MLDAARFAVKRLGGIALSSRSCRTRTVSASAAACLRRAKIAAAWTKLWEMRFSGRHGIARAIYVTAIGRRVIVVHAFVKKTQKTPRAAMELAARRVQEIQS